MQKIQSILKLAKNSKFILTLILVVFFLKGVFFASLYPIFGGQDESRHYSSIQYINEPNKKTQEIIPRKQIRDKESITDFNFSNEIIGTGIATDFDIIRHKLFDTANFSRDFYGPNESEILSKQWEPINYYDPPDTAGKSLYHKLGAKIENIFQNDNILVRFYSIRIFSVLLGTLAIFLAYLIAKNIGFSQRASLILTTIVAFQPKYAIYTGNINYDALLIPMFFLFTLGGILSLKSGLNWKNIFLMSAAIIIAFFTKGTGLVLLAVFSLIVVFHIIRNLKNKNIYSKKILLSSIIILVGIFFFLDYNFLSLFSMKGNFSEIVGSLIKYSSGSLTSGRIALTTRTYWGSLSWNDSLIEDNLVNFIWIITAIATFGITVFLFSKKKISHLPEKKYVIFLIVMVAALQFGIRFFDWKVFSKTGGFDLGAPGRYFLPNLAAHIILIYVGIGTLLKKEKYFNIALVSGLILMFTFSFYLIFNVILPRYYL